MPIDHERLGVPLLEGCQEGLRSLPSAESGDQDAPGNLGHCPGCRWHPTRNLAGIAAADEGWSSNEPLGLGVAEQLANGQWSHGRVIRQLRTIGQANCPHAAEHALGESGSDTLQAMSDTEDEDAEIRRPWTLGKRVRLAMRLKGWVGWGAQQKLCQASGIGRSYVSAILGDGEKMQNPSPETREKLSEALGVPPWAWQGTTDDQFQAALESVEQEGPARQLADYSGGKEESHALASFLTEGGAVEGALATDTVTLVIGKPEKAKMRHNARSNQKSKIEHISLSGVPLGAEIVLVKSRVELRDTDESLAPGYLLYVDRKGEPQSGRLVIAKRDIDPRLPAPDDDREKALADVRLFRYHKVGRGWSLEPIDGSGQNVGPGDGWVIVAAVLMWRSPP